MLLSDATPDEKRLPELSSQLPFELDRWRIEPARLTMKNAIVERRLEPRVMALLVTLARAQREVVSRAELLDVVWADVTVGDEALTMAISKLRRALGERADGGAFIETIPRVGYRLLVEAPPAAGVRSESSGPSDGGQPADEDRISMPPSLAPPEPAAAATGGAVRLWRDRLWRGWRWIFIVSLAALTMIVWSSERRIEPHLSHDPGRDASPPQPRVVTAYPGLESQATFDPTSRRVAFQRQEDGRFSLVVLDLASNESLTVYDGGPLHSPAWSPIDQRIAFVRFGEGRKASLSVVAAAGGPVEDLLEIEPSRLSGIDWSPDARYLAWSGRLEELGTHALHELELASGQVRRLTVPSTETIGDGRPTYSPDGRFIALTRGPQNHLYNYDLWLLDRRSGELRRLTHDGERIWGFDWLPDSSGLIFSSNRTGRFQLWTLPLAGAAEPTWIPTAGDQVRFPRISGSTLIYDIFEVPSDLLELAEDGTVTSLDDVNSKGRESAPAFSPDGRRLAFGSDRGAAVEVWIREADGSTRRLSRLGASMIFRLAWSPDACHLAALLILDGQPTVTVLDVRTGEARNLKIPPGTMSDGPIFAPDGKSVFLANDASGRFEIWRVDLAPGAEPEQVTDLGAVAIRFGTDGTRWVLSEESRDLLRQSGDGEWDLVLENLEPRAAFSWAVVGETVHALHAEADRGLVWKRRSPETGSAEALASLPPRLDNGGFTVHPSGRRMVTARFLAMESDLRLMSLPKGIP